MKNLTYINVIILLVMTIWTNAALAIPSITATTSAGTTIKFTATLSEKLLSGYKVKIDYGNGKGLVAMTCSSTTCTLSSNSLPVGVNSASYKIGIYNAKGILQGTTTDGIYTIGSITSSNYSKISNSGAILPDTAILGTGENDWACTKDNKTGLTWEIKTTNGFRHMDRLYTNYLLGENGALLREGNYGANNNADVFIKTVNNQTLCGKSDWRLPTKDELLSLITCFDNLCKDDFNYPAINLNYFPNTIGSIYWSSSINRSSKYSADNSSFGWCVDFTTGSTLGILKGELNFIRLVR